MRTRMSCLWLLLAVIFGLGVGLLIGWVVWPIQWIDASPEQLRSEFQSEWINMAIDSYSVNSNAELATQRFEQLGPGGPQILTDILNNPVWVTPADALSYSEAVGQGGTVDTLQNAPKDLSTFFTELLKPALAPYAALLLFLVLVALTLMVILIIRLASKKPDKVAPQAAVIRAPAVSQEQVVPVKPAEEVVPVVVEPPVEAAVSERVEDELVPTAVATEGIEWALESETKASTEIVEESLPGDVVSGEEEGPVEEGDQGNGAGELAAAGLVVAAAAHEKEAQAPEVVQEGEAVETRGADFEGDLSAKPESEWGAVVAAAATVAAVTASAKGEGEETIEMASPEEAAEEADLEGGVTVEPDSEWGAVTAAAAATMAAVTASAKGEGEETIEMASPEEAAEEAELEVSVTGEPDSEWGAVAAAATAAAVASAKDEAEETIEMASPEETAEEAALEGGATVEPDSEWGAVATATASVAAVDAGAEDKFEEAPDLAFQAPAEEVVEETAEVEEKFGERPVEDLPKFLYGRYNRKIIDIEGVGPYYSDILTEAGVPTTQALLQECATSKGREDLAARTGISNKLILEWANHADMMRIQGIGPEWSDLLEMAGVNTVRELAQRKPSHLLEKISEVNKEKNLVRKLPTQEQVEDWIEQAKELPRILTY